VLTTVLLVPLHMLMICFHVSSSLCKLQLILDLCCVVGSSYDLSFNPSKCLCGVFGTRNISVAASLSVSDTALTWCDKMTYLGITFIFGRDVFVDITNRLHKFHAAVFAILKNKMLGFEHIYVNLMLTKCLPLLFYG
jgi:hypothetical protein